MQANTRTLNTRGALSQNDGRASSAKLEDAARRRVVIEGVTPAIDDGRFPAKRVVGERVVVEADIFADGHDALSAALLYRREIDSDWTEVPLEPLVNDRWRGSFAVTQLGRYCFTLQGWVDHFKSWARDFGKRLEAAQEVAVDLLIGADLVAEASERATGGDALVLQAYAATLRAGGDEACQQALSPELAALMRRHGVRPDLASYEKTLSVAVDRERARYSTWYELFPRSWGAVAGEHGTFKELEARLPYVAAMGFDVVYLPPIHPIGRAYRKGRNNTTVSGPGDPGSPWAIGGPEGGHKAVHPQLGTLDDFRALVTRARGYGLEIALDLAFQCSPDHPYVREHPEWFRRRPDGTIQYAENPPKKYQDIYPFDFETEHWRDLWAELASVVRFWIEQGVRIFRVDNPHTKPFRFWEWLIGEVKRDEPGAIFLAEAFTRPKVMYQLAKLGFTQSYTYFAWRHARWELEQYFTELTRTAVHDFFRPNLWPNTPDILTDFLQHGGRPAFMGRLVLAATLGASYGIYGPAFELGEHVAVAAGSEEYLESEKYEIKRWDLDRPESLRAFIARVNAIRRSNPALQTDSGLRFHAVDNDQLIAYSKTSDDATNVVLTIVNLDPYHTQSGFVTLPLEELGVDAAQGYQVHDLLSEARYLWHGERNYVELNPYVVPAHVLRIRHHTHTEHDFDYFL